MKIVVPCGGRSSRYPNMPPKWILPDHDGLPMVVRSVSKLEYDPKDLVVTILAEHEAKYNVTSGLAEAFGSAVTTVVLEQPTRSQSETVAETLKRLDLREPFIVKDSDNGFRLRELSCATNYVTVSSLNDHDMINPQNKSYVAVDQENFITAIREKQVISDKFSVGGYFFRSPEMFLAAFHRLDGDPSISKSEIYISEIISYLLLKGETFKARHCEAYEDWGTVHEWRRKLENRKLFFVSVDGFLFERGSAHFRPGFAEARPNPRAVEAVRRLSDAGHRIVYLSIRPGDLEGSTRTAILELGLPDGQIVMECELSQWMLVTSPHPSLPFSTCRATELLPDDENMLEKLVGLR